MKSKENPPNVNTAVGGAPCFKTQASQFNFENAGHVILEPSGYKFDLT
jgi:hypothetical protein